MVMENWLRTIALASTATYAYASQACLVRNPLTGATSRYSCKSTEYCCGTGCCTKIIALWYMWVIIFVCVIGCCIFTCWYKKRKKRLLRVVPVPKLAPVKTEPIPVQPSPSAPPPYNPQEHYPLHSAAPPSYSTLGSTDETQGVQRPPPAYPQDQPDQPQIN